jgi:hypothetical protein
LEIVPVAFGDHQASFWDAILFRLLWFRLRLPADARLAVNYLDQDKDGGSVFCHFPLPFFLFVVSIPASSSYIIVTVN